MGTGMDQTNPPTLLDLPRELLHNIITDCDPQDIAAFRQACLNLKEFVDGDKLLYRDIYLKHYDNPNASSWDASNTWESNVKSFTKLQKLLDSKSLDNKLESLRDLAPTIEYLVKHSQPPSTPFELSSRNTIIVNRAFKNETNREAYLARSSLFAWALGQEQTHYVDEETSQASAKLHVFYGAPIRLTKEAYRRVRLDMFARSRVYDLRRYTDASFWGPFYSDRSAKVDWEKLQAIMLVIQYNLYQFHERTSKRFPLLWHTPWAGIAPKSFVSPVDWRQKKREHDEQLKESGIEVDEATLNQEAHEEEMREKDPYNITGTWMRVVCFLDYSDLYSFNFSDPRPPDDAPRPALDQEEAIRLITMKLRVTKLEPAGEDNMPGSVVAHFEGTSRSMHIGWDPNANSGVREWELKGTVCTTREGEVRWTSFSVFHGEERWRSEGVQVGGPQSARGVWGTWFDKDFDREGPAGPTAFWKLTDELPPNNDTQSVSVATTNSSQPLFVNNGQPNDHRAGHRGSDSRTARGVFGAAASPEREEDEQEDDADKSSAPSQYAVNVRNDGEGSAGDGQIAEGQHPYNQTIPTEDDDEQDEVLLEIEEDEDGQERNTITLPASSILEILEAGDDDWSSEDDDYQPPAVPPAEPPEEDRSD